MRRAWLAALAAIVPAWLGAQPFVVSPRPEAVLVTVYRGEEGDLDLEWLKGYAFITETRTIDLPQGASEIRFEGVAGGIIPVSAMVRGLPAPLAEKNRDARLISPGGLVDAMLGKRVQIRRTSRATGKVTETDALLTSGPGGVILQTPEGIEALRCTGLPETLVYEGVPEGLSDRPTLSIRTTSTAATRATVSLSYLATGFDWRASYVVSMAPDGRKLDLFSWVTLANGNDESFVGAQTQTVAGRPNKEQGKDDLAGSDVPTELSLECWPFGTTSDVPFRSPPQLQAQAEYDMSDADEIVVTARRRDEKMAFAASTVVAAMTAQQEELGDLKLYRIPEPVTVAARAQKQVAMLTRTAVRYERLYGAYLNAWNAQEPQPARIMLRLKNEKKHGLGLPLPYGSVAVFEPVEGWPMLVGETEMEDTAIGQKLDLVVGESPQVVITQRLLKDPDARAGVRSRFEVEVTNANPYPVTVETVLGVGEDQRLVRPSRKLDHGEGRTLWRTKVKANGRAILSYGVRRIEQVEEDDDED